MFAVILNPLAVSAAYRNSRPGLGGHLFPAADAVFKEYPREIGVPRPPRGDLNGERRGEDGDVVGRRRGCRVIVTLQSILEELIKA